MFELKRDLLNTYREKRNENAKFGTIGIPLVLNMYDLLPFWHTLFTSLGFDVVVSPNSTQKMFLKGQATIPSDTVCYPAKLVHGHIDELIDMGVKTIFYPAMTRNVDEGLGDRNFNCPVVAYYPEVIRSNVARLNEINFINDYVGLHRPKDFIPRIQKILEKSFIFFIYLFFFHNNFFFYFFLWIFFNYFLFFFYLFFHRF